MVRKLEISSFHPKLNGINIPLIASYMSQTLHEGLVLQI